MTVSTVYQPFTYSQIKSSVYYTFTASNTNFTYFKYTNKVYTYDRLDNSKYEYMGIYKNSPNPEGFGEFDPHKILVTKTGAYNAPLTQSLIEPVYDNNCLVKWRLKYGAEWDPQVRFSDTFSYSYVSTEQITWNGHVTFQLFGGLNSIFNLDYLTNPFPIPLGLAGYSATITVSGAVNTGNNGNKTVIYSDGIEYLIISQTITAETNTNVQIIFTKINTLTNLGLSFSTAPDIKIGDEITVEKDNQYVNGSYNGLSLVKGLTNSNKGVITDVIYGIYVANEGGIITRQQRDCGTSSFAYGLPAYRLYEDINKDFGLNNIQDPNNKLLSNWNNSSKKVLLDQYESQQFLLTRFDLTDSDIQIQIHTYDANGNFIQSFYSNYIMTGSTQPYHIYNIGTGYANLDGLVLPSSGDIVDLSDAYSYTIHLYSTLGEIDMYIYRTIDRTCSIYDNKRILFQNSLGGYDLFNFRHESKKTTNISRIEAVTPLRSRYNVGDRQTKSMHTVSGETWTVNSEFLSEDEFLKLKDILDSEDVFLIDETTLQRFPINITDNQIIDKRYRTDKLFNLTLNFKMSNKKYI